MIILETERLILRTLESDDLDSVMTFWGDAEVMRYCGGAGAREREQRALQYYTNLQEEKGFSPYLTLLKPDHQVIGVCGFNPPTHGYDAELMYHFAKPYWEKGYATEAAKACIQYAENHLDLVRIGASIDPENQASRHVLEKVGFQSVGMKWCEATQQYEPYFEITI